MLGLFRLSYRAEVHLVGATQEGATCRKGRRRKSSYGATIFGFGNLPFSHPDLYFGTHQHGGPVL